jgi:hypothetical protein
MHVSDSFALVIATLVLVALGAHALIALRAARQQRAWLQTNGDIIAGRGNADVDPCRRLCEQNVNLASQLERVAFRLHRVVPEDLTRYVEEATKLKAEQMTGQAWARAENEKARGDDLESWLAAVCGGRERMQQQANQGLPERISSETRGRLASHLERHQIRISCTKPSSGSGGDHGTGTVGMGARRRPDTGQR